MAEVKNKAVERNKTFMGTSFNRHTLSGISSYADFEKKYANKTFLDGNGKPLSDEKDRLRKAFEYLLPEVAEKEKTPKTK